MTQLPPDQNGEVQAVEEILDGKRNWKALAADVLERVLRTVFVTTGGTLAIGVSSWHALWVVLISAVATVVLGVGSSAVGTDPNSASIR